MKEIKHVIQETSEVEYQDEEYVYAYFSLSAEQVSSAKIKTQTKINDYFSKNWNSAKDLEKLRFDFCGKSILFAIRFPMHVMETKMWSY